MRRRLALMALLALAPACARTRTRYLVSNEASDYSPSVRLAVHAVARGDSAYVRVDSGIVVAPGLEEQGPRRALMRRLTIEAIVAEPAPAGTTTVDAEGRTVMAYWRPVVTSAPRPLVDSLVMAVPVRVGAMAWVLPLPDSTVARRGWVVFRVRGAAMAQGAVREDGLPMFEGEMADAIRVFACADRRLSGRADRARAKAQRASYLRTC